MKILIIPAFFQTRQRPTAGSFFLEQAKALQNAGHQVTILYSDTYSVKCIAEWVSYREENSITPEGIRIYRKKVFCPLKHGMEGHRENFAREILSLYQKYLTKEKPDIIHAHCCVWAGYAAMRLSQMTGIPYVITEHATMFQLHSESISQKNDRYIREAFQNADSVICVSNAFREVLSVYRSKNEIQVIGNVVDCSAFRVDGETQKKDKDGFQFLTVCYMQTEDQLRKKGIDILLKAWKKVQEQFPKARLVIGGGGQATSKAVEWCKACGVSETVTFAGALDRAEVIRQMQNCDCFVLPSRYETFGVVYIEAMACGKPVIAAANGGPDDFISKENGILVPVEDIDALADAMLTMIETGKNYQPDKIRESIQKFSAPSIAAQLTAIYQKILTSKG